MKNIPNSIILFPHPYVMPSVIFPEGLSFPNPFIIQRFPKQLHKINPINYTSLVLYKLKPPLFEHIDPPPINTSALRHRFHPQPITTHQQYLFNAPGCHLQPIRQSGTWRGRFRTWQCVSVGNTDTYDTDAAYIAPAY